MSFILFVKKFNINIFYISIFEQLLYLLWEAIVSFIGNISWKSLSKSWASKALSSVSIKNKLKFIYWRTLSEFGISQTYHSSDKTGHPAEVENQFYSDIDNYRVDLYKADRTVFPSHIRLCLRCSEMNK